MSEFTKITVSAEQVIDTLRAVADERPDYVYELPAHMDGYPMCRYVHTDEESGALAEAGCIVGTVLHRLGVPLDVLAEGDITGRADRVVPLFLDITGPNASKAQSILSYAQNAQDGGYDTGRKSWAKAVEYAEERFSEPYAYAA